MSFFEDLSIVPSFKSFTFFICDFQEQGNRTLGLQGKQPSLVIMLKEHIRRSLKKANVC